MNICIRDRITHKWSSSVGRNGGVSAAVRDAYAGYKERETPHVTSEYIVYRPDNDPYLPTYIARLADIPRDVLNDGTGAGAGTGAIMISREIHDSMVAAAVSSVTPIMDMNDVSVFIVSQRSGVEMDRANWVPSREYQAWAYRDFIYDEHRSIKKSYMTRNTSPIAYASNDNILANQIVTIPLADTMPHIVFNVARNENNSVYFERNDAAMSRVRICDNEYARAEYLEFYTRNTTAGCL